MADYTKWAAITFGVGMLLIVFEYVIASKKKGGVSPTDKKRMIGLFWLSLFCAGTVGALLWLA